MEYETIGNIIYILILLILMGGAMFAFYKAINQKFDPEVDECINWMCTYPNPFGSVLIKYTDDYGITECQNSSGKYCNGEDCTSLNLITADCIKWIDKNSTCKCCIQHGWFTIDICRDDISLEECNNLSVNGEKLDYVCNPLKTTPSFG